MTTQELTGGDVANLTWLNPPEAAVYTGFKEKTLRNWRSMGIGPLYSKSSPGRTGHIRYRRRDLDAWLTQKAR